VFYANGQYLEGLERLEQLLSVVERFERLERASVLKASRLKPPAYFIHLHL
jgi:hypothetical protein